MPSSAAARTRLLRCFRSASQMRNFIAGQAGRRRQRKTFGTSGNQVARQRIRSGRLCASDRFGQVGRRNDSPSAKRRHALNHVLQFANVARPRIRLESTDRFGAMPMIPCAWANGCSLRNRLREMQNVALRSRRGGSGTRRHPGDRTGRRRNRSLATSCSSATLEIAMIRARKGNT